VVRAGCSAMCAVVVLDCAAPARPLQVAGSLVGIAQPVLDIGR
jgi:hypothetical protein